MEKEELERVKLKLEIFKLVIQIPLVTIALIVGIDKLLSI